MEGKFGLSTNNNGIFHGEFDTREDAIKEAIEGYGVTDNDPLFTGRYKRIGFSLDGDSVLEELHEQACSEAGEVAEDFLWDVPEDQKNELQDALNEVLTDWMDRHGYSNSIFSVADEVDHRK